MKYSPSDLRQPLPQEDSHHADAGLVRRGAVPVRIAGGGPRRLQPGSGSRRRRPPGRGQQGLHHPAAAHLLQRALAQIPGVTLVTHANWFGGVYQDERNFFPQFAIEDETYRQMFPEFIVPEDSGTPSSATAKGPSSAKTWSSASTGRSATASPSRARFFPAPGSSTSAASIRAAGRRTTPPSSGSATSTWRSARTLIGRAWSAGTPCASTIPTTPPAWPAPIDEMFANSPWETKTETEKAFAAGFVKQAGNIEFLLVSIGSVVFFTLLLVTGNTMAIAVRERMRELAVLKAVGFSDVFVLSARAGRIAAARRHRRRTRTRALQALHPPRRSHRRHDALFLSGAAGGDPGIRCSALAVGVVAGILPAWSAMRLRVVDALRRV